MYLKGSLTSKNTQAGFTLFELLVSIAIITIITAVVVIRYSSFYSSVLLKNQAYEIALNLREAQVFSISARVESGEAREEYGLYFNTASPNTYQLFQDIGTSEPVTYNSGEDIGDATTIDTRFQISKLCVNDCATDVDNLSVSFERPNFDAIPTYSSGGAVYEVNNARIEIQSVVDNSAVMAVEISSTGQVTVINDSI